MKKKTHKHMHKRLLVLFAVVLTMIAVCSFAMADKIHVISRISATTASVGDTFTFTVSMTGDTISSVGVDVTVSDGMEIVSGEWLQQGLIADYDAAHQKGAFMPPSATQMSGDIFRLTVKLTGSAGGEKPVSIRVIARNGSKTVFEETTSQNIKVTCQWHTFGPGAPHSNGYEHNDKGHYKTCTACGYVKTGEHNWDGGGVTKAPTCTDTGIRTYTCVVCNHQKDEDIPANGHSYSAWKMTDFDVHSKQCTGCGDVVSEPHHLDDGKVTKQATCRGSGEKQYTCKECGYHVNEPIQRLPHTYDDDFDDACNVCGLVRTVPDKTVPGDADGDGVLEASDCLKARRAFFGLAPTTDKILRAVDFNHNGRVDASDCMKQRRMFFGLIA